MAGVGNTEQNERTEALTNSDQALASLFRSVHKIERNEEGNSGMMFETNEASITHAFAVWLETNKPEISENLNEDEVVKLGKDVASIFDAVHEFRGTLKSGHMYSLFQYPSDGQRPSEICRFAGYDIVQPSPSAIVYLEKGVLKYRMGKKEDEKEVFDLSSQSDKVQSGVIENWKPETDEDTANKLQRVLKREIVSKGTGGTYSIGDVLGIEKNAYMNGEADVGWEECNKSFDAQTYGLKAAGFLVFGYIDGEGKFYPATSKENVFDVYDRTDDVQVIAYNPQPVKVNVKVEGYSKDGTPVFGLDNEPENT